MFAAVVRFQSLLGGIFVIYFLLFHKIFKACYIYIFLFLIYFSIPHLLFVYYFCLFSEILGFVVEYFLYKPIIDRLNTIYRAINSLFLLYLYNVIVYPSL